MNKLKMNKSNVIRLSVFLLAFSVMVYALWHSKPQNPKLLTADEALQVAESTEEVKSFLVLSDTYGFKQCILKESVAPCDSGWVTCIDDAWVVTFRVKEGCLTAQDERLGVTLLIDSKNGMIISRFPEKEYFQSSRYCLEDYDCEILNMPSAMECLNFIFSSLKTSGSGAGNPNGNCACLESQCSLK